MSRIIYLHGFASSPASKKARFFKDRFAELGIGLEIPDLAEGNFERLTITGQLQVIERTARGEPVHLMGSSMGGYLAALYAARHPEVEKLMLMAPAFSFPSRWPETLGEQVMEHWRATNQMTVFHYAEGREMALGYQLMEDAKQYESYPKFTQPVLIFHGCSDTVVPLEYSVRFAERQAKAILHMVNSDHELIDVLDLMWRETEEFFFGA